MEASLRQRDEIIYLLISITVNFLFLKFTSINPIAVIVFNTSLASELYVPKLYIPSVLSKLSVGHYFKTRCQNALKCYCGLVTLEMVIKTLSCYYFLLAEKSELLLLQS